MTELNTLKKKSPADLWKEDLAAFSEQLEVLAFYLSTPVQLLDFALVLETCSIRGLDHEHTCFAH